jgi:hypothetical protein
MNMADFYFSAKVGDDTTLCIAPLTDRRIELSGEELEDASGYFLYTTIGGSEPCEVQIIARIASEEAAFTLRRMLSLD